MRDLEERVLEAVGLSEPPEPVVFVAFDEDADDEECDCREEDCLCRPRS
jgi:hypothetical protein